MLRELKHRRSFIDEPNEYRILRLVRDSNSISRTEISQLCDLSKTTVTEIVSRFIEHGFLESIGEGSSTSRGGRKRELLKFNPRAGYVFGIDIRMRSAQVVATDLNANILRRESFPHDVSSSASTVLEHIATILEEWRALDANLFAHAVGIGIGLPGLIDERTGIVRAADTLKGWKGTDLRTFFEERFDIPVFVENDVKAMTLAEYLFGAGKYIPNQVFFWIGDGVGAGIMIDGKLHHGRTSSAGEVGYNELGYVLASKERFPLLYNGQKDLGEILADPSIVRAYHAGGGDVAVCTADAVAAAAGAGEQIALRVINEVTSVLAVACINIINMLNPEIIVLGGSISHEPLVTRMLQDKVREDLLTEPAQAVEIHPAKLNNDGVVLGAVGLVLYDLFKPSHRSNVLPLAAYDE